MFIECCPDCEEEITSASYWCEKLNRDIEAWYCSKCEKYFLVTEILEIPSE